MLFLHASKMSGPQIAVPLPVAVNVVASGSALQRPGSSFRFRAYDVAAERTGGRGCEGVVRPSRPSVVRPSVIAAAKFATVKGKIHPSPAPLLAWPAGERNACMHSSAAAEGRPTDRTSAV